MGADAGADDDSDLCGRRLRGDAAFSMETAQPGQASRENSDQESGLSGQAPSEGAADASDHPAAAGNASSDASAESENDEPIPLAEDISELCYYNTSKPGTPHILTDHQYNRTYETVSRNGVHAVVLRSEGEKLIGALYVQWDWIPLPLAVQVPQGEDWVTVATTEGDFFADYIPFPECSECRIVCRDNPKTPLQLVELRVLTAGQPAADIQVWEKAEGKMDLMLISGHPDDELLWFGGALPTYAGQLKKRTLVICFSLSAKLRRLELCDALWACGVRIHPLYLHRKDISDTDRRRILREWNQERTLTEITTYYRQFKPDVVLLHDVNGEYGHGVHRAASWIGTECVARAADPSVDPESAELYGLWDIPKVYVHLLEENQIHLDWHQPLEAFGGKTGLEVAQDALQLHKSQVVHGWKIEDGGEHDNAVFGLYHSTVGPDEAKNDFFEHIPE